MTDSIARLRPLSAIRQELVECQAVLGLIGSGRERVARALTMLDAMEQDNTAAMSGNGTRVAPMSDPACEGHTLRGGSP